MVEWDARKAAANRRKHGVSFAEAVIALEDDLALTLLEVHPAENRYVTLGCDAEGRILCVVYTWNDDIIRLISARRATPSERSAYLWRR